MVFALWANHNVAATVTITAGRTLSVLMVLLTGSGALGQSNFGGPLKTVDVLRFERKILRISGRDTNAESDGQRLVLFEREVNAYLKSEASTRLPSSLMEPKLSILGDDRVKVAVTIDLEGLRNSRDRSTFDLLSYLGGKVPVTATGALSATAGVGRINVERVTLAGVTVPASVLYQLVRYYTRNDLYPRGFNVTAPFELPYGIREVSIEMGRAVVIQ